MLLRNWRKCSRNRQKGDLKNLTEKKKKDEENLWFGKEKTEKGYYNNAKIFEIV